MNDLRQWASACMASWDNSPAGKFLALPQQLRQLHRLIVHCQHFLAERLPFNPSELFAGRARDNRDFVFPFEVGLYLR